MFGVSTPLENISLMRLRPALRCEETWQCLRETHEATMSWAWTQSDRTGESFLAFLLYAKALSEATCNLMSRVLHRINVWNHRTSQLTLLITNHTLFIYWNEWNSLILSSDYLGLSSMIAFQRLLISWQHSGEIMHNVHVLHNIILHINSASPVVRKRVFLQPADGRGVPPRSTRFSTNPNADSYHNWNGKIKYLFHSFIWEIKDVNTFLIYTS